MITQTNNGSTVQIELVAEGAQTYWSLGGYINGYTLRQAARAAGLDPALFPKDPTPADALRRAVADQQSKRVKVQSLSEACWAIIRSPEKAEASAVGRTAEPRTVLTCRVDNATATLVFSGPEENDALRYNVQEAYHTHLSQLDASVDIGGWLKDLVVSLQGVAMRPHGGIYYLPPAAMATWRAFVAVLQNVSPLCSVYEVTLKGTAETVRSVTAAIVYEAEKASNELMGKIEAGKLGERSLKARQKECDALCQKLEQYEAILGQSLANVKAQVEATGAAAMAAALVASAEVDTASAA